MTNPTLNPGDPVPGSRYFREFCSRCKEPLRVERHNIGALNYCEACDPPHQGVGNHVTFSLDNDPDAYKRSDQ